MRPENHLGLPDTQQTFWQLSVIQLSGWISLPILAASIIILQTNSFLGSVLTIIVGNAILWFLRLAIVMMSHKKRQSTLDVARDYLGKKGSYFIGVLLVASTLAWFVAQTTAASSALTRLISINESPDIDQFIQMSVFLGIVSTFLCMEGMKLLRKVATICFPFLIVAFFIVLFTLPAKSLEGNGNPTSLAGLTLVLANNLGITSDLPTFFRHSRSLVDSIKGLTIVQVVSVGLGICSLYFGSILNLGFNIDDQAVLSSGNNLLRIGLIVFVFFSVICANVANVYSASVGWEVIAPKALVGRKEYLIIGLGLTTIFILVSKVISTDYLLEVSDSSLVNLCIVLIMGYLFSRSVGRSPSPIEQVFYFLGWLVSTIVNAFQYAGILVLAISPFLTGLAIVMLIVGISLVWMRFRKS